MLWQDLIGEAWEYLNLAAEQMPHDIGDRTGLEPRPTDKHKQREAILMTNIFQPTQQGFVPFLRTPSTTDAVGIAK